MKFLGKIFAFLIAMALLLHGYFYLQYNQVEPCAAAVERIKQDVDKEGTLGKIAGGLISLGQDAGFQKDMEGSIRSEGISKCYEIALLGMQNK